MGRIVPASTLRCEAASSSAGDTGVGHHLRLRSLISTALYSVENGRIVDAWCEM